MEEKKQNTMKYPSERFPIRLCSSRAWRTYLGGKLLDGFYGKPQCEDGHFPEEWITSLVEARNAGREHIREEGMSHLADAPALTLKTVLEKNPGGYLGENWYEKFGVSMGVLVKLIDSAERLTIQVHPDREKALALFQSQYGKTECWHILGGRTIDGEEPCIYLGFRPGITPAYWKELFEQQDIDGMLNCMHRFPVKAGDTILIEGGIPHAIGAGCFLVEIQEPTDYTIRVEKTTPSGYSVDDFMCHQGLGFDLMFDCFHYDALTEKETREKWFIKSKTVGEGEGWQRIALVDYTDTPFFKMDMLTASGAVSLRQEDVCSALYVLEGEGKLTGDAGEVAISKGDQFFVPANVEQLTFIPAHGKTLKLIQCYGPALM